MRKVFAANVRRAECLQHCDVVVLQAGISMRLVHKIVSTYHMDLPDHHILWLPNSQCGELVVLKPDRRRTVLALHLEQNAAKRDGAAVLNIVLIARLFPNMNLKSNGTVTLHQLLVNACVITV